MWAIPPRSRWLGLPVSVALTATVGRSGFCYSSQVPANEIPPPEKRQLRAARRVFESAPVELRRATLAAHEAGGSIRSIADELEVSTRTVQDWIVRARAERASR